MASPFLTPSRRRFLAMLWLSAALHAAVLGLTRLPQPVALPHAPELRVELALPEPAARPLPPTPEPRPPQPLPPQVAAPRLQMPQPAAPAAAPAPRLSAATDIAAPQAADTAAPGPVPAAAVPAPAIPAAAPSHETPGLQLAIPQLSDPRYYTAKELDVRPERLSGPEKPTYPPQAEDQGVVGRVVIRLHLEADGSISKTEVVSSAPGGVFGELFRQATLDWVAAIRFRPAQRNGRPVRAVVEIPVVFRPDG